MTYIIGGMPPIDALDQEPPSLEINVTFTLRHMTPGNGALTAQDFIHDLTRMPGGWEATTLEVQRMRMVRSAPRK